MQIDEGLDSGPVLSRHSISIHSGEDCGTLTQRLSILAAEVLRQDLHRAIRGELRPEPQDAALVTLAPPIRHEDQVLGFEQSAESLECRIRAFAPKPGAVTQVRGKRLKIMAARIASESTIGPPGTVSVLKRRVLVATGQGCLELLRLQLEGKAVQSAADLVNGRGLVDGDLLGGAGA
jgi:methionyl-tRNA formyltransferase